MLVVTWVDQKVVMLDKLTVASKVDQKVAPRADWLVV